MKRRNYFVLFAIIVLIVLTIFFKDFFKIDECLDAGGSWNYYKCECNYN